MAKRILDWNLKGTKLVMGKYIDAETPSEDLEEFDIEILYPMFKEFNEVQKHLVEYGIKQKLADAGSAEKIASDKADCAKKLWKMFENGEYKAPRTGGEAKENKRIATEGKKMAEVVSLEGLITKKTLFPDTFTKEDEAKLQEFLAIAAEHAGRK